MQESSWLSYNPLMVVLLYSLTVLLVPVVSAADSPGSVLLIQQADGFAVGPTEEDLEQDFRRTRDVLRASSEFQGDGADAHYRLGKILHHRGDMIGATEEYGLAVQRNPDFVEAYRDLGTLLLDRHDYVGAVTALEKAVQLGRQDGETYYWLGRGLMGKGDLTKGAVALRAATRIKPNDAEVYADFGLVLMAEGDVAGATQALRTSIELKPDNADAHALMETLTAHQADRDQVMRAAQKILAALFAR